MAGRAIEIHGARQNNLRGVTVEFPHHAVSVITGPSGSGKSSLAFDTLYAEGQRRYIESLSTYAKQFLERMPKPVVDRIDGIFPAVAIEQKNPTTSSRSTVGTATEIHDFLRLLWARVGRQHCHRCGGNVESESPSTGAARLIEDHPGRKITIGFTLSHSDQTDHDLLLENLVAMGFVRVFAEEFHRLDELPASIRLDSYRDLVVVVDRTVSSEDNRSRIADSLTQAFLEGEGRATIILDDDRFELSNRPRCVACGTVSDAPSPNLFSFNNPRGACPTCNGFGAILEYDESLIVPDPELSLSEGALDPWMKPRYTSRRSLLRDTARKRGIPYDRPWKSLAKKHRHFLLREESGRYVGMYPFLRGLEVKRYKQYIRVFLRQYQKAIVCHDCQGARLRPEAMAVTVDGHTIAAVSAFTASDLAVWLDTLSLDDRESEIAATILTELRSRAHFLCDVGLGYITMERQTRTLSGGEAQRISLANALGARLVDTLYVLDEPSIGLHPRDIDRLLALIRRLRDTGNTVVVVEHDPATMRIADHIVELGPQSGRQGGEVVFAGNLDALSRAGSLTAEYFSGKRSVPVPSQRRPAGTRRVTVTGARLHNIDGIDVSFPLGTLTVVTGVSGSGKSTLVHDILYRNVARLLRGHHGAKEHLGEEIGEVTSVSGWEALDDIILIDQSPIGRTPRSNPITYVRAFDEIRALFASQPLARARGLSMTDFSFNAPNGGRCATCEGAGHLQVEMVFLADVFVPCDDCGATRFRSDILDVKIKGFSVHDVLQLTVDEAIQRFRHQEKLGKALWHLQQVGLGYLKLGQPATTLSGGEAQRLKIARQLASVSRKTKRRLYILDEPTTGLHMHDVHTLLKVLDRLVDHGHTVIVIEHNLDLMKRADWVIDLGPEGGSGGGRIVAVGTPEEVAESAGHTGRYLKTVLTNGTARSHPRASLQPSTS